MFKYRLWVFFVCASVFISSLYVQTVMADISSCSASVSPHSTTRGTSTRYDFTVSAPEQIERAEITRPSGNFAITNAGGGSWNINAISEDKVTLIRGGSDYSFFIDATSGGSDAPSANWTVQVSDDPGGTPLTTCGGSLGTAISGEGPDTTPPVITGTSASNLTSSSINISWQTDEPATSRVDYGLDEGYGEVKSSSGLTTSHSLTLTGLTSNTGYHYQVTSSDAADNSASSSDNTFLTPLPGTSSGSSSAPLNTAIPLKAVPTEKIPPTINLSSIIKNPYKEAPELSGTATDNEMLAGIEYSLDGGKNWLPVNTSAGLGTKKATFSFKPQNLEDGNYSIVLRAIDTSSNTATTQPQTLIIDRLPPVVGGNLVAIGPQVLHPGEDGIMESMVGVDQKITLSAVGGPISINIEARPAEEGTKSQNFSLSQSPDTGLWGGILNFRDPGGYELVAEAIDGAGSKTSRVIKKVFVHPTGKLLKKEALSTISGTVSVYYLEPDSGSWVVWDGATYGQKNPQHAKDGQFSLFLPAGSYYLKVDAQDYHPLKSNIIKISEPQPISSVLRMQPAGGVEIGPFRLDWPRFSTEKVDISLKSGGVAASSLLGKDLPAFSLKNTNGQEINSVSLLGRPTLISVMATWSPTTSEQMQTLGLAKVNPDINIVPFSLEERPAKVRVFSKLSGHSYDWLTDPDGSLSDSFDVQALPSHYFIDRKGIVRSIKSGVLSKDEILKVLLQL